MVFRIILSLTFVVLISITSCSKNRCICPNSDVNLEGFKIDYQTNKPKINICGMSLNRIDGNFCNFKAIYICRPGEKAIEKKDCTHPERCVPIGKYTAQCGLEGIDQ